MFERRSNEVEYLDHPDCDPELSFQSYVFMEKVNQCFGGINNVRRFIRHELKGIDKSTPLRILDIGSGSCDIPVEILRWARDKKVPIHFTCIEKSPHAVKIAGEKISREKDLPIELKQEDIFSHQPSQSYDCAVASMCFHHFEDEKILALMEQLRGYVHKSVLINDLRRSPFSIMGSIPLTAFSVEGVRHDARLSVRRGFKTRELRRILTQLDNVSVSVKAAWLFRVCAVVRFEGEGLL